MAKEIEIEPEGEYEIMPLTPIRHLEKRVEELEKEHKGSEERELVRDVVELIRSNQTVVDDIIKADDKLRDELSKIPKKIDELLSKWEEFFDILKRSALSEEGGSEPKKSSHLEEQNKSILETNKQILEALNSLKRRSPMVKRSTMIKYPKVMLKRT